MPSRANFLPPPAPPGPFHSNTLQLDPDLLSVPPEAILASPQAVLPREQSKAASPQIRPRLDSLFLAGSMIAVAALLIGIASTGISLSYFLQPTGAIIVLGGTLGITLVTTPRSSLIHTARCLFDLLAASEPNPQALIDEITDHARARRRGITALEVAIPSVRDPFLRQGLQLAVDLTDRKELQSILEMQVRMAERQGDSDAKTLEVAGGFAPTIGIIGTVIGLIDVLRNFSNLQTVGHGIGIAFVSTLYGLALANLVLLPAAHRVRARVAENFETQELILEGVLAIVDSVHPALIRLRLEPFARRAAGDAHA